MKSVSLEGDDNEFPAMPKGFNKFVVTPSDTIKVSEKVWKTEIKLKNDAKTGVLFKVKCNSNALLKIIGCADILLPGYAINVELERQEASPDAEVNVTVFYCLVGKQWTSESANVYECWKRATGQRVHVLSVKLPVVVKK
ncbi:hypothetical protein QR680_006858 [Steinernema hermaphroditum]|uniref:Major sperm protein n=1 Tax=Steinernema hermaphroditum TaxID=289476 RepID=A0AA39LXS7_9BILA|nr:hypothetical protein QR680_006858 [Steinernema hermaphroditum]